MLIQSAGYILHCDKSKIFLETILCSGVKWFYVESIYFEVQPDLQMAVSIFHCDKSKLKRMAATFCMGFFCSAALKIVVQQMRLVNQSSFKLVVFVT